ncbi:MAG TPA: hypothetical protein VHA11_06475 [Bryobacteraceae bacterium]|nr:hypothetical protein [Bryobacteraceae bacterium]
MRSGTARSKASDAQPFSGYFEWRPAGGTISIYLSFAVMDQLEAGVMKGFWSVPKRGAEVGGVLFGRAEVSETETVVHIDDFEPVECEHRRGPSYVLSEPDKRRLERTLRKGRTERQVIGFYRSHTRPGLYLDQDDFTLIQNYFPGSSQVFLLVRPHASKTSAGGFFFWEEGTIRRQATYLEFPFSRAEILKERGQAAPPLEVEQEAPQPPVEPPPAHAPVMRGAVRRQPVRPAVPRLPSIPWETYAATARAFLDKAARRAVLGFQHAGWRPWAVAAAILVGMALIEYPLAKLLARRTVASAERSRLPALHIERNGTYLQVNWNRSASVVTRARGGVLEITDGASRRELQLDTHQLRTGGVAYSPTTNDVSFRLELMGSDGNVSESLRVVEGAGLPVSRAANPPQPVPAQDLQPAAPPPAAPVHTAAAAAQPHKTHKPAAKTPRRPPRAVWYDDGL